MQSPSIPFTSVVKITELVQILCCGIYFVAYINPNWSYGRLIADASTNSKLYLIWINASQTPPNLTSIQKCCNPESF